MLVSTVINTAVAATIVCFKTTTKHTMPVTLPSVTISFNGTLA